jgi:hypothetical protein
MRKFDADFISFYIHTYIYFPHPTQREILAGPRLRVASSRGSD